MKIVNISNSPPLNVFLMCYMKNWWIAALQLSTLSDASYCIEYLLTQLFHVEKESQNFCGMQ